MKKIVECVPNFSEGRNSEVIEAIARAIRKTPGCILLDVDPGKSTNRTVYTFVGDPEAVVEGALAAARVARDRIDMGLHQGEHPRFGAMDVCPFVPVAGVTMDECVALSKVFAQKMAQELSVPVFLYEESAKADYRKKLPDIREGEYEGLEARLKDPRWQPDFGSAVFVPAWGATATGARKFLIAYNVNILGTPNQAHRIALNLREAGRGENDPGRFKEVKGMGWFVDEYNMAQVTVNITDYKVTPVHLLYEAVKEEARGLKIGVAGSEIVGVVPLEAMIMAADYYIQSEDLFIYQDEHKIRLAVERLGLNSVSRFDPGQKIIEYRVAEPTEEPIASMTLRGFIEELASRSSAPGGGSASAVMAAMGTGLGSMVAKLTQGVRRFETVEFKMRKCIPILHDLTQKLLPMIDADTAAFNDYMEALRMPKITEDEKALRRQKMQEGLKTAISVPLSAMETADAAWDALCEVAQYGNPGSSSDVQVGARALETGIWGAYQNVLINMEGIVDAEYRNQVMKKAEAINGRARQQCARVLEIIRSRKSIPK